jgi:RimJ/RimL family protein N-acetyltransferase
MSASEKTTGTLSTYAFPDALTVDEVLLRAPRAEDIDTIAPAFLDPDVGGEAGLPPFTAEMLRAMLDTQLPELRERGLLAPYVLEDARTGALLGGATLHHLDSMRDTVEVGYWLFVDARGRGVATRAVRALCEHAHANGIYRVEAHVRVGNTASERVLERVGFAREGVKRRFLRHGPERVDATLFGRNADDR